MGLQSKAWLIVAGSLLVLGLIMAAGVEWIVGQNFNDLEKHYARENVIRANLAIDSRAQLYERLARDYASWRATYEFMAQPSQAYLDANFTDLALRNLELDAFLLFDLEGHFKAGRVVTDVERARGIGVRELAAVFSPIAARVSMNRHQKASGLFRMPAGDLLFFSALPILKNDDSGPPAGGLVQARFIDQAYLDSLSELLRLPVTIQSLPKEQTLWQRDDVEDPEVKIEYLDARRIQVDSPLGNEEGVVIAELSFVEERDIFLNGWQARVLFYGLLAGVILIASVLMTWLLRSQVIDRVGALGQRLAKISDDDDLNERLPTEGSDEITQLGEEFNNMLDRLQQARAQREQLNAQLEQSQKLKEIGTLAGGLAHDFNNLLSAIQTTVALLRMEAPKEASQRSEFDRIEAACQHGASIVRQMISFSRQDPAKLVPLSLTATVEEALTFLRAGISTGIEFRFESTLEDDIVRGDSNQLHTVMVNLANNASHAMGGKSGVFSVRLEDAALPDPDFPETAKLEPGDYVRITVSDTGCGIPPEHMEQLFLPFFSTKPPGSGSGLGLPVVHGIITAHQGSIGVRSQPGKGAAFIIHLPKSTETNDSLPKRGETKASGKDPSAAASKKILLVDDDEAVRDSLCDALSHFGFEVTTAKDGQDAWMHFEEDPDRFDLLLTDQRMPKLTGTELGKRIIQRRPDMPMILHTGFGDTLREEDVLAIGFARMLIKPVIVQKLIECLQEVSSSTGKQAGE